MPGYGQRLVFTLYFVKMFRRNKVLARSILLALMLVVGSVQAHVSYMCGMMDMVIHDDCCCADSEVDDMALTDSEPCCDKVVELGIDAASDQSQTSIKPIKFESDVDPPEAFASAIEHSLPSPDTISMSGASQPETFQTAGSATYLITQRLRI